MLARSVLRVLARGGVVKIAAVVMAFLGTSASAQNAAAPEAVVITARPPDPVGNAAFSTVLIDAGQLQTTPKLDTAIREVPGLSYFSDFSTLAALPHRIGVSIRSLIAGSGIARALVTVDGVPQNDPFAANVIPASLPAENLSSVEIVRGAGAGPYGAGALTGVVELNERDAPGVLAEAEGGNLDQQRYMLIANTQTGIINFGASGMYGRSGGWFSVRPAQRGATDTPVSIEVSNLSAHATAEVLDGTLLAVRFGAYDERRAPGTVGTEQDAKGVTGSATIARPEETGGLGWRAQIWFRNSDYASSTDSLSSDRNSATPFLNGYATPALGWGANAAVRGTAPWLDWEIGTDSRFNQGEARELSSWVGGAFQADRFSGGRAFVGGIYAEGASHINDLLLTGGIRIDEWRNSGGQSIERSISTGAVLLDDEFPARSGAVPSARAGIRRDFSGGWFARAAGYEGFRPPSLSELYRPTPGAVSITDANPALNPERLHGMDAGIGGATGPLSWDVNGFWNRISGAISGVTLGVGPGLFPDVGFLPRGSRYVQLENVGFIQGVGAEGEAEWRIDDLLSLHGAFNITDARVNGGASKPALTGKRPAATPRLSISGGFVVFPLPDLSVEADVAYISKRFVDDQNTDVLGGAAVFNATVTWHATAETAFYLAGQNLGNTRIAFTEANVRIYDQPLAIRAGVTINVEP